MLGGLIAGWKPGDWQVEPWGAFFLQNFLDMLLKAQQVVGSYDDQFINCALQKCHFLATGSGCSLRICSCRARRGLTSS